MERIVRVRSATLTRTFTFTPTGTPSVVVRNSAGTVVTTGSVSGATTTWTYTIPASSNPLLDTYTETWTAVAGGESQTFVDSIEVAGDTLFTLAEVRAIQALASTVTYPDADVLDKRTEVEQDIEQEAGVAFVPRYELETLDGSGGATVMLKRPRVRSIRSASISGTALSVDELAQLAVSTTGAVYRPAGWPCGLGNVVIGYEHGFDDAPRPIKSGALELAKIRLLGRNSPIDERATTFAAENGVSYGLVVAGRGGSRFGLPDLDAAIDRYSMATMVA